MTPENVSYPDNVIYIIGNAKVAQNNPIQHQYGQFFIGFVVDRGTGSILKCGASTVSPLTSEFIGALFIGRSLRDDPETIRRTLENRYFGSSQRAILVAFRDAQKKFLRLQDGLPVDLSD